MSGRKIGLLLLLLATGGFVAWASLSGAPGTGGGTGVPPGPGGGGTGVPGGAPGGGAAEGPSAAGAFSHPRQCAACHAKEWEEWSTSMHARAWTDPEVRALSDDFRSTECLSCHAPQPLHFAPVGGRVFERSSRFETGVDCLSCHLLPDGGVAATRDLPSAPCRPRKVETLGDAVTCKGCHNQHYLVDEYETLYRSPDPAAGALLRTPGTEDCTSCHMRPVERAAAGGGTRPGFDHVFRGGHYEEVLREGMEFRARVEGGEVLAETTAARVGHRAPADSRHRSFNVWVTVTTEGGVKVHDRAELAEYRMYYRSPPRENTNLRPGETALSRFPLPRGVKGTVRAELVYCMNPVKKERREAKVVHAVELPFDTTK